MGDVQLSDQMTSEHPFQKVLERKELTLTTQNNYNNYYWTTDLGVKIIVKSLAIQWPQQKASK